jgi:hypothetical protein
MVHTKKQQMKKQVKPIDTMLMEVGAKSTKQKPTTVPKTNLTAVSLWKIVKRTWDYL